MMSDLDRRARMFAALGEPLRLAIVDRLALADAAPGELGRAFDIPTNLLAHHLRVLEEAELIRRVRSEGDRRRSYVRLLGEDPLVGRLTERADGGDRSAAVAGLHEGEVASAPRVVFVCTHNSARSQLAAAIWKGLSGTPVASAGTKPAGRVHPRAVAVGSAHGLRLAGAPTAHTDDVLRDGDLVVAVCDNAHEDLDRAEREARNGAAARTRLHWSTPDPVRIDTDDAFEATYQEIARRVDRLARAVHPNHSRPRGADRDDRADRAERARATKPTTTTTRTRSIR